MRQSRTARLFALGAASVLISVVIVPAAHASPPTPNASASLAQLRKTASYFDPSIRPDAVGVYLSTDGAAMPPSSGMSAMTSCGPYDAWAPFGGGWGSTSIGLSCYVIGTSTSTTKTYWWEAQGDVLACAEGRGFYNDGTAFWGSLGCGSGNSAPIHWGLAVAYPRLHAMSLALAVGEFVSWT